MGCVMIGIKNSLHNLLSFVISSNDIIAHFLYMFGTITKPNVTYAITLSSSFANITCVFIR